MNNWPNVLQQVIFFDFHYKHQVATFLLKQKKVSYFIESLTQPLVPECQQKHQYLTQISLIHCTQFGAKLLNTADGHNRSFLSIFLGNSSSLHIQTTYTPITFLHSNVTQMKAKMLTMPPDATAMSWSWFFLLSPNPGAFTAHTWRPTFNLKCNETKWFKPDRQILKWEGRMC